MCHPWWSHRLTAQISNISSKTKIQAPGKKTLKGSESNRNKEFLFQANCSDNLSTCFFPSWRLQAEPDPAKQRHSLTSLSQRLPLPVCRYQCITTGSDSESGFDSATRADVGVELEPELEVLCDANGTWSSWSSWSSWSCLRLQTLQSECRIWQSLPPRFARVRSMRPIKPRLGGRGTTGTPELPLRTRQRVRNAENR